MIKHGLRKQTNINTFQFGQQNKIPQANQLTAGDRVMLNDIHIKLKPLYTLTMHTQGSGRLWQVMTRVEFLLEHLESWRAFYNDKALEQPAQWQGHEPSPISKSQIII